MSRQRVHREWFRQISKKTCPSCGTHRTAVWSWGEYVNGRWSTVQHFCEECFPSIRARLIQHAGGCGCVFELVGYRGDTLPTWLTMETAHGQARDGHSVSAVG